MRNPKFFIKLTYFDTHTRAAHASVEKRTLRTMAISVSSSKKSMTYLDLSCDECKPEHIQKLRKWDKKTYLPVWCGLNGIPYYNFKRRLLDRSIIDVDGEVIEIPLEGKTKHKRITPTQRIRQWNTTNRIHIWEPTECE